MRGYSWIVIPVTWRNRRSGEAKLKIKEMGSRYLFICLYVWLEKFFSRGDYMKPSAPTETQMEPNAEPRQAKGPSGINLISRK